MSISEGPEPRFSLMNYVASLDTESLIESLKGWGYNVVTLDGSKVRDKASLMAQATVDLPAFDEARPKNWAGFNDATGSMFFEFDESKIALVWTSAHTMLESGLADFVTAIDVFTTLARRGVDHDVTFLVFFTGEGLNFPAWMPDAA